VTGVAALVGLAWAGSVALAADPEPPPVDAKTALVEQIRAAHGLTDAQTAAVRAVLERSDRAGQGLEPPTVHAMSPAQCLAGAQAAGLDFRDAEHERICGGPYMAPLYDPDTQTAASATACIDLFEFPDIPCTFPVIWVRAKEAAELCTAMGKRLCDAHEWEGACDGHLQAPDYRFDLAAGQPAGTAVAAMRAAHNAAQQDRTWAYGASSYTRGVCAAASTKSDGCDGSDWRRCGSNTYPTGAFPQCVSPLGVYDLHGNAAEHMNLPLAPDQLASAGSTQLGVTEMKGSWFIFDSYVAHEDWCRWRAPYWHGGPVMADDSHRNYHLGFRCCRTIEPSP
jgi:hypothetical protein